MEIQIEPRITKLQAFAWKIHAPPKIRYYIWQMISGQLEVTSNLTHCPCDVTTIILDVAQMMKL